MAEINGFYAVQLDTVDFEAEDLQKFLDELEIEAELVDDTGACDLYEYRAREANDLDALISKFWGGDAALAEGVEFVQA